MRGVLGRRSSVRDGTPPGLACRPVYSALAVVNAPLAGASVFRVGPFGAASGALGALEALLPPDLDLAAIVAVDLCAINGDPGLAPSHLDCDVLVFGRRHTAGCARGG